jgi:hypothetical protein
MAQPFGAGSNAGARCPQMSDFAYVFLRREAGTLNMLRNHSGRNCCFLFRIQP